MEKKTTSKTKKQGDNNIALKIVSTILILFTILCIVIIFKDRNYSLILPVIGIVFLVITTNIASRFKVDKNNVKVVSKASIVIDIISIPLLFNYVIFSYALVIPAFMLSSKCKKITNEQLTSRSYLLSAILLIVCVITSIVRYIIVLNK